MHICTQKVWGEIGVRRFFNMNFDTKVLAVFFAALFLLSVAHFFVYPRIWSAAEQDALRSNTEHLDSAVRGANATLDSLWGSFSKLIINKGTLYNADTEEDLDNIIRFYETPSGRRMADAQPKIATDAMGVAQQWAMQFAQKMGEIFKSAQASEPSSVPGK